MLEALRQGANSWVAKALMAVLVLSFVGWGVSTRSLSGSRQTLIEVGGQSVTADQYRRLFDAELRRLEVQSNRSIDPATARQFGLDQRIFSGLIADSAARSMNMGISDQALLEVLSQQKNLQTADGRFDKDAFGFLLRRLQLTEQDFLDRLRRDLVRDQLLGSVSGGAPAPAALAEAFNQFQNEQRKIDYFFISASAVPVPAAPSEADLKAFFDGVKEQYTAPEYRSAGVLVASPDDLKSTITIADEDARPIFEQTKDSFGTPEKRHVQIMSFQDKAQAGKALDSLKTGKDFLAVAKEMGLADKDVDRGLITKKELLDKVAGEEAFKLEKDKVSGMIEGALATSLVRVTEIQPALVKTYDDVKDEIKGRLAREKALKALIDYRAKIEEARDGGTQLKDLPAKFPFKYTVIPLVDATGMGVDGKSVVASLNAAPTILKQIFASDVGVEADPIDLGKDGWAWSEVKEVKPKRQKALDEVKADVVKAYQDSKTDEALRSLGTALADRINKGEDFAAVAKEKGAEVKTATAVTRNGKAADLPPTAQQLAFSLAKGSAGSLPAADGKSRLILRPVEIEAAKPLDADKSKQFSAQFAQELAGTLETEYLSGLQQSLGFRIDEKQFQQLAGNGAPDDQSSQ